MAGDATRRFWLEAVDALTDDMVSEIVHGIPDLSQPTRTFITTLVSINRRRILDEC